VEWSYGGNEIKGWQQSTYELGKFLGESLKPLVNRANVVGLSNQESLSRFNQPFMAENVWKILATHEHQPDFDQLVWRRRFDSRQGSLMKSASRVQGYRKLFRSHTGTR
jgi:hypothetical protein